MESSTYARLPRITLKFDVNIIAQENLDQTSKLLAKTEEELRKSQYALRERDFVISEHCKAENALTHQACIQRSDLEKALKDNALLFSKIAREDKLSLENRAVVSNFQVGLAEQIGNLCSMVATSVTQQNEHLESVEKLCHSFLDFHDKSVLAVKKKVASLRALYISHLQGLQNVERLHKASVNAEKDEISSITSVNAYSIDQEWWTYLYMEPSDSQPYLHLVDIVDAFGWHLSPGCPLLSKFEKSAPI